MDRRYQKPLNVVGPDKKQVVAVIARAGTNIIIEVPYYEAVKDDGPGFANNGLIRIVVQDHHKYMPTVELVTKYLESVFKEGFAHEDIHTGLGAIPPKRRAKRNDPNRAVREIEGDRSPASVPAGTRRDEPTKSTRRRSPKPKVAEGSDSSAEGSGKDGD